MNIIDDASLLLQRDDVKEGTINFALDSISALTGDIAAIGRIILTLRKTPCLFREQIFWSKMELFLKGVYQSADDIELLKKKLDDMATNNPLRLIESIDRAETNRKIQYLINSTRCLMKDLISLPMYFRICYAIRQVVDEDLQFLKRCDENTIIPYSIAVQGLQSSGLLYQSVIDGGHANESEDDRSSYAFTPLGRAVRDYALSYDEVHARPFPSSESESSTLMTRIAGLEWNELSLDNKIESALNNKTATDEEYEEAMKPFVNLNNKHTH